MAAITVCDLVKRFGDTTVLDGVSLEVPDGAFSVLVGPSGCGKSTLLRLLAGLEEPTAGRILFDERDVTDAEPRDRDIAMVFQSYALYPHLSVEKNLAFGLEIRKVAPDEIRTRVETVSDMLGLKTLLQRMPSELSGGQRQRVAMGRAIVRRPGVFMFDEPLSNLDAALRGQVRVDIRRLHSELKTTSVYVTHDQVEAMTLADVMFVMNEGKIEQSGAPLTIFNRPASRFVAGFLGSPPMSFIDATIAQSSEGCVARIVAKEDELCLPLDPSIYREALADGQPVVLGLRPHEIRVVDAAAPLRARVLLSEKLGSETHVYASLAGTEITVRVDGELSLQDGQELGLDMEAGAIHLFDPDTGKSWW